MKLHRGRYFDGKTAQHREVSAQVVQDSLRIVDTSGGPVAAWRLDELRLVEPVRAGRPLRLMSEASPEARLTMEDTAIAAALRAHGRPRLRRGIGVGRGQRKLLAVAVGAVLFVGGAIASLPYASGPLAAVLPAAWAEAMGAGFVDSMGERFSFCQGADGLATLARLSERLAATVDTPYSFKLRVVDSPSVNAFAAPGGHIVLLNGLIENAEGPDEVAGVLAHEMGHVIHRHPTRGLIRRFGFTVMLRGLLGGDLAGSLGATLIDLSYTREDEAAADAAAVDILRRAGLRADGLARFFARRSAKAKTMAKADPDGETSVADLMVYFSTHPSSAAREQAVTQQAGEGGAHALDDREWQALRNICES